jgi:hypothetical protein
MSTYTAIQTPHIASLPTHIQDNYTTLPIINTYVYKVRSVTTITTLPAGWPVFDCRHISPSTTRWRSPLRPTHSAAQRVPWSLFLWVKRSKRERDHLTPPTATLVNAWSYIPAPPIHLYGAPGSNFTDTFSRQTLHPVIIELRSVTPCELAPNASMFKANVTGRPASGPADSTYNQNLATCNIKTAERTLNRLYGFVMRREMYVCQREWYIPSVL